MKLSFTKILMILAFLTAGLAACAAPGTEETPPVKVTPTAEPEATPLPVITPEEKPEIVFDPNDPIKAIKQFLYENYRITPDEVSLVDQQEREWSDSCLGLGGIDELCMQVITRGYLVVVETPLGNFSFHTASSLDNFRLAGSLLGEEPNSFDPEMRFQWLLAGRLNISIDQVKLVSKESVEWPNACLGVEEPGVMCAEVITPGYRLTFSTPQGEVVIHTDADLRYYRTPEPLPGEDRSLLVWERSGGIAGICERLTVSFDGAYQIVKCSGEVMAENIMEITDYEQLVTLAATYNPTEWKYQPPAGSADMFVDGYTFNGIGSESADAAQQESLNEAFALLAQNLMNQPTIK